MPNETEDLESVMGDAVKNTGPTPGAQEKEVTPKRKANEVFSSESPNPASPIPQMSREEYLEREIGLQIPVDAVPLPTRGLLYPAGHSLHGVDQVEYRAMTAREEDILMSRALIKKGTVITELIRSCLTDSSIDVGSLISGDRTALMIAIRISGYDRAYNPEVTCPECQVKNQMHIDLAELELKVLEIQPVEPGHNAFSFKLPMTNKTVLFKYLTVKEEEVISQEAESRRKRGILNENLVTTKLLNSIISIDGIDTPGNIRKFVNNMPAKDSRDFRKYMDDNEPGVKMEVEFNCEQCDHYDNIALPMGSEFFWPKT